MKYFVAGQKKESIFNIRKNRIKLRVIAYTLLFASSLLFDDVIRALIDTLRVVALFFLVDLLGSFFTKDKEKNYVTSLKIINDNITLESFYKKHDQSVLIENIKKIDRSLTEITIVSKEGKGIVIPLTIFSYNDIQLIKAEMDRVKERIEPSQNLSMVSLEY